MTLKPETTLLKEPISGVSTFDLQFLENAKSSKTYVFEMAEEGCAPLTTKSWSIYIDVDANNCPVAMTFVHHKDAPITYTQCKTQEEATRAVQTLFGFSKQLIDMMIASERIVHSHMQARRNKIFSNTTRQLSTLSSQVAENIAGLEKYKRAGGNFACAR